MGKRITKQLIAEAAAILDTEKHLFSGRLQSRLHLSAKEAERLMEHLKKENIIDNTGHAPKKKSL